MFLCLYCSVECCGPCFFSREFARDVPGNPVTSHGSTDCTLPIKEVGLSAFGAATFFVLKLDYMIDRVFSLLLFAVTLV